MSMTMLKFAQSFVNERLTADVFADAYMELWRIERDNHIILQDEAQLSECLSTIFCLSDMYYPIEKRAPGDLDEEQLRIKVSEEIQRHQEFFDEEN